MSFAQSGAEKAPPTFMTPESDTLKHQKQDARQLAPEREHATETTVAARVSHRTKAALKQLAEQQGTDTSKLVARLIRQELARVADE